VTIDPPLITALITTGREKRRDVPLHAIPPVMIQAVLAIEDRRFYEHPGIDPLGMGGASCSATSSATSPTWRAAARSPSSW
jgi:membrane peptidoglycan carboxypeptidase